MLIYKGAKMFDKNQVAIARDILDKRPHGVEYAAYKLGEELAELTKELFKQFNVGKDRRAQIIEEMGDVVCNMEFVKLAMNIDDADIKKRVDEKFERIVDKARRQGIEI
jgi:NTP pyrophosphatase (non-canonical NTP hydrolase)